MTKLNKIYKEIQKEKRRIQMMNNTIGLGQFKWTEIRKSKVRLLILQLELDSEYNLQNQTI